ncbi:MAG: ATP-dependent helicase [Anaerolineae bacterium]|jgi:DNA helicase II / ATP-dependent DNA helicase PcrA|nr:ATP-dependent helicase [Anaerolineae bacterium]MBT7070245.1 ATP-dependent helicase [Anaerolineae bacterium]MBT7325317.1 ATP-dependent helicase [Anaerolineae bacterium]
MNITYRPSQQKILQYTHGTMGIAAVPGSGKTFTLSALAAEIIGRGDLAPEQEVLIVTLVNSAVDNFSSRINDFITARGLLPRVGYRVRTLHGLAHDIVREKPGIVGLDERFGIIDEREANYIRKEAVSAWLAANPNALDDFLDPDMEESKKDWTRRQQLPRSLEGIALAFIRSAKDRRILPDQLRAQLANQPAPLPLAEMGLAIYSDYQRALAYRGAVDFDDLIRLSLDLLERDPDFLERLRYRWPYILEDEAQDSSQTQEKILRLLSGEGGNWVRVGDPNQAIFETFTTANPQLLRDFIANEANFQRELPESGRSQPAVIDLANQLIDWVMTGHPDPDARDALSPPYVQPTAPDDPQPNPPVNWAGLHLITKKYSPEAELKAIIDSLARWVPENPDKTVAVLVPRNTRGAEIADRLKKEGIEVIEALSSTQSTRQTAGALGNIVQYLSDPQSASKLATVYRVWRREWRDDDEYTEFYKHITKLIKKTGMVESFLAPTHDEDWLASLQESESEDVIQELTFFKENVQRWLDAVTLPIDQLILTLAQDLFTEAADLALAHKLAIVLRQTANDHSEWRLPELTGELSVIAKNQRKFIGFSADDGGFDPERYKGKVVVTTMHKAKGLEWDRVYLTSVNSYTFPSNQPNDNFISEKWFVRDNLNLEAEAIAQLDAATQTGEYEWYSEGQATLAARVDYVRERLRLLYVGITRAKEELVITWNTGRGESTQALPFAALVREE